MAERKLTPQEAQFGVDLKGAVKSGEQAQYGEMLKELEQSTPAPGLQTTAPPTGDPTTKMYADMIRELDGDDGHAGITQIFGEPEGAGALEGISAFFSKLDAPTARGMADSLGLPVDLLQGAAQYYSSNPALSATGEPALMPEGGVPKTSIYGQKMGDFAGGSKSIRKLAGSVGIDTTLPSERGDFSHSGAWAESLGYGVGTAIPFMPFSAAGAARAATGPVAGVVEATKNVAGQTGLALVAGGAGRELADKIAPRGTAESKMGEAGGALAAGGAIAGAVTGLKILTTAGAQALAHSSTPGIWNLLRSGELGASGLARGIADDPQRAATNAMHLGGRMGEANMLGLPEGFQVPAFTASMDLPIQALGHQVVTKDAFANAQYRQVLQENEAILKRLAPGQNEPGFEDSAGFLQQLNNQSVSVKEKLIQEALDQADRDLSVATKGATLNPEEVEGIKRGYEIDLRGRLVQSWAEANAATKAEFDGARALGLDASSVPTTRLYDRMADMMSDAITKGMEDHFPARVLGPLYNKSPLKMFDAQGKPIGDVTENYMLGSTAPWARMQGLFNNVSDELAGELRKAKPDPVKLTYLNQMQDEALVAMKDLRMGGKFAPGQLPVQLQRAIESAQENRRLFVDSPVGGLLGFDRGGAIDLAPEQSIKRWLGNSPQTSQKVQALYDAVGSRSMALGVHPADALNESLHGYMRQEFADNFRTGGVKAAGKWMDKNDALLDNPQFVGLRDEFRTSLNSRQVAEKMMGEGQADIDAIRRGRAEAFLNADPETAMQKALTGPSKFTATRELIEDLRQDPTGRALQGFGNMAFDRMVATASLKNPLNEPGKAFLGSNAEEYLVKNQGMFEALGREIPGYRQRVEQWVMGAKMMDRIVAKPDVPLNAKEVEIFGTGLAMLTGKVVGAWVGRQFNTGTIQVPGMMSSAFGAMVNRVMKDMPMANTQRLLSEAMIDPKLFQQLMQPIKTPQDAKAFELLLEPYILATPATIKGTAEQTASPQPPMEEKRGLFYMPGQAPK